MSNNETVIHVFWERVAKSPERAAIMHKVAGAYQTLTWQEHGKIVETCAAALLSLGVTRGDRAAIMSVSKPHWTWADIGTLSVGAITVPVYPSLNAREADYLLTHAGARIAFVENPRQLRKLLSLPQLPSSLQFLVLFEGEWNEPVPLKIMPWHDFLQAGSDYLAREPDCVKAACARVKPEDLATIVYTSGTTGVPKGARILHSNIYFICKTLSANVGFSSEDVALSFLPLSHIFERIGGQFLCIYEGIVMAYAEQMETVAENVLEVRPTIMNAVPRFYEKVYNKIQSHIRTLPTPQQYFARWAISIGRRALRARQQEQDPEAAQRLFRTELRIADRFVFSKIRQRLGGRMRFLVSGAAPLSGEIQNFFQILGMPILEGYGLTETTAPVCCNRPGTIKQGTVGRPLPGMEIKIAPDGEILVRGPGVFAGYYNNPEATQAAFAGDWFMTGDIGEVDEEGYLRIRDRKKDIIITAGGKHVAPAVIENLLCGQGLISRVLVYGDRRKYISALVTLNGDELTTFAAAHGLSGSPAELARSSQVISEVQRQIDEANARLASFEQVKRFLILDHDFTIEADELTPTLKLKRKAVTVKYQNLLDGLYEQEDLAIEKDLVG